VGAGGLIKLLRIGGKTLISAETVEDIRTGKIELPGHAARKHRPEPKARTGRPRKGASKGGQKPTPRRSR
jgi:hypothetical protein